MLSFFQRKKPLLVRAAPEGMRLYAVGDVHGRLDALDVLIGAIRVDAAQDDLHPVLVMLGDYVDRGPSSRGVIQRLVELENDPMLTTRFVRGNHDDTMMRFVTEPSIGTSWCSYGGAETLQSYGVSAPSINNDANAWMAVQAAFAAVLPDEHLFFLKSLESFVEYGDYFFTHAGVRPGIKLNEQNKFDLMWIREEFLSSSKTMSKTVVHGHTPEQDAFICDRRIGVDTGAYATGRLTAIVLEGVERRLIQARVSGHRTTVEHLSV